MKKNIAFLTFFVLVLSTSIKSNCEINTIYQKSTTSIVTSGTYLEEITILSTDGWLSINVLKTDLNNPNTKIETIFNHESINTPTSLLSLVNLNNAVGGINGNFFTKSISASEVFPIGIIKNQGNILLADSELNSLQNKMANFTIDSSNLAHINYLNPTITIKAPNGKKESILRYNKPYIYHDQLCIIDKSSYKMSIGSDDPTKDLVEMIVVEGVVSDIRDSHSPTEIPENGYIVIGRKSYKNFILDNFIIGDDVSLEIETEPDWLEIDTSITGGSIIIQNGIIPKTFTHDASNLGRNPRTAVGTSKDRKTVYFVTIDGRQQKSIGMTMKELSNFMLSIGVYNALNLDGGGSTTLSARREGNVFNELINTPSDGYQRKIASGLGIFSTNKSSNLNYLKFINPPTKLFKNTFTVFDIKGFDFNNNPVNLVKSKIKFTAVGVEGYFSENIFTPTGSGKGKITATYNELTTSIDIDILEKPFELYYSNFKTEDIDYLEIQKNTDYEIAVFGQSKKPKNLLENLFINTLCQKANDSFDSFIFVGKTNHSNSLLDIPNLSTNNTFNSYILGNNQFIQLDMSENSLLFPNSNQWVSFLNSINNSTEKNQFIFLSNNPLQFNDPLENNLFNEILFEKYKKSRQNIWVIYESDMNNTFYKKGIKFIEIKGFDKYSIKPQSSFSVEYLLINLYNDIPTYKFETLF